MINDSINNKSTMIASKSDFGIHGQNLPLYNPSSPIIVKSLKSLKTVKSAYGSMIKNTAFKIDTLAASTIDEQNNENADDYCKKLRHQQAKMFWNKSNHEYRNRVYKKNQPVEIIINSNYCSQSTQIIDEGVDQKNQNNIEQLVIGDNNDDAINLELMISPKVPFGFEHSSKKWTSMYTLRNSFRNLTACVSNKNRYTKKK